MVSGLPSGFKSFCVGPVFSLSVSNIAITACGGTASGGSAITQGNYNHDVVLSDSFYIRQLDFGR